VEHATKTLFQNGTSADPILTNAPHVTRTTSLRHRRLLFAGFCILIYVLLDRTTVYLQIWPDISAWYPPTGFSVALMIAIGPEVIPAFLIAGYLSGYLNYHQSLTSLPFLLATPLVVFGYATASLYLRKKLGPHFRVRSTRDVVTFLGVCLHCSLAVAPVGTAILVYSGEVPLHKVFQASFNWWVADAFTLSSVTSSYSNMFFLLFAAFLAFHPMSRNIPPGKTHPGVRSVFSRASAWPRCSPC